MASTLPSSVRTGASAITMLPVAATSRHTDIQSPNRLTNRICMFIFLCVMSYGVDHPEDRRRDASERGAGVASIGFFVNARTFVATLGCFCFDAVRREFDTVSPGAGV